MPIDELVFGQGPIMTEAHVEAMKRVEALWPFPAEFERKLLGEVVRHLEALQRSPVPTRAAGSYPADWGEYEAVIGREPAARYLDDWRVVWRAPTVEECYDCDQ